jgi:hypothetical protein
MAKERTNSQYVLSIKNPKLLWTKIN